MKKLEKQILAVLDEPRSNGEIARLTGIEPAVVGTVLRHMRETGRIVSTGATSARKHMRLSTAIGELMDELEDLRKRLEEVEEPQRSLGLDR